MLLHRTGAAVLVLASVAVTTLTACSQPNVVSCGTVTQTSTKAVKPANAKFPLFTVHIEPAAGVQPLNVYDVNRSDNLGYPQGETALDMYFPAGTYVLHGRNKDGTKCQTAFEVV